LEDVGFFLATVVASERQTAVAEAAVTAVEGPKVEVEGP
tara:strand:- start:5 stop:121 length:117 start_codon:yes stop_codon:yes gene_type:complete